MLLRRDISYYLDLSRLTVVLTPSCCTRHLDDMLNKNFGFTEMLLAQVANIYSNKTNAFHMSSGPLKEDCRLGVGVIVRNRMVRLVGF